MYDTKYSYHLKIVNMVSGTKSDNLGFAVLLIPRAGPVIDLLPDSIITHKDDTPLQLTLQCW